LLDWLYTAIAWVMKEWHSLFSTFLDPSSGITWALSIVFLVVTVRIVLFRFFIKQVKSQRAMQELQPEIQKLKKQYGSDRQGFSQATMALQKERGVNPLAGCLPILPQIPVFISLLHTLRRLAPGKPGLYSWDDALTDQAAKAKLFGAPISSSFNMQEPKQTAILALTHGYGAIRTVALVLIVVMCTTTFFTQKQIMRRSGPVEGQAAMVQRLMLYGMPLSLFASGFFFPIGVLIYWLTNNLWTLGQQFYILKKLPPPGSAGAKAAVDAGKPVVDPKTLAPRPGAKPVRSKAGRPAAGADGVTAAVSLDKADTDAAPETGPATSGSTAARAGGGAAKAARANGNAAPAGGTNGSSAGAQGAHGDPTRNGSAGGGAGSGNRSGAPAGSGGGGSKAKRKRR
jgi:YidC/Oxa1 family membrane protein insertase